MKLRGILLIGILFSLLIANTIALVNIKASNGNIRINGNNLMGVKGDGKIISEEIIIKDYSKIESSGPIDVVYEQLVNDASYLRIEIDQNLRQYITIETKDDRLILKTTSNIIPTKCVVYTNSSLLSAIQKSGSGNVLLKNKIVAEKLDISQSGSGDFTAKMLNCNVFNAKKSGSGDIVIGGIVDKCNISTSGSGDFITQDMRYNDLNITLAGSGDVKAKTIDCKNLKINKSGSCDVNISGTAENGIIRSSGSGDVHAKDLKINKMDASISGSGKMEIYVLENLKAKASGSSYIRYKGSPQVSSSVSGRSKIKPF